MTSSRPDTWMPFYIGDYLADTLHLTRDQHGGYVLLIMAYWRNAGPLDDDDAQLGAIVKASPAEWRRLRSGLARFFVVGNGLWTHKRIDKELLDASVAYSKRKTRSDAANAAKATSKETSKETNKVADKVADKETVEGTQPQPQPQSPSEMGGSGSARALIEIFDEARVAVFGPEQARPWKHQTDLATAQKWLNDGADATLVAGALEPAMRAMKARGKPPPASLSGVNFTIADALAARDTPMPKGYANGAGNHDRPPPRQSATEAALAGLALARSGARGDG